jgi:hypothetical protein
MGHELQAVADAKDGNSQTKNAGIRKRRIWLINAPRTAGENERRRVLFFYSRKRSIEGEDFRINAQLSCFSGDELSVLGAEIEDEDFIHLPILANRIAAVNKRPHLFSRDEK